MKQETAIEIKEWLTLAFDTPTGYSGTEVTEHFERGLALLGEVYANPFYLKNIRKKGPVKGMGTLRHELNKRVSSFSRVTRDQVSSEKQIAGSMEHGEESSRFLPSYSGSGSKLLSGNDGPSTLLLTQGTEQGATGGRFVLREEFPFLGEKDCPDEFKVMVADMITSHRNYVDGHERLYYVADKSNEECYAAAEKVVENYLNNRAIWEELEYYQKSGKILGKHRAFDRLRRREEIENMSAPELMKLYRTLPRNIAHAKKMIQDAKDSEGTKDRMDRIKKSEEELKMVKRMMEVESKKSEPQIKRIKQKK